MSRSGYSGGPSVITRILISGARGQRSVVDVKMEEGGCDRAEDAGGLQTPKSHLLPGSFRKEPVLPTS